MNTTPASFKVIRVTFQEELLVIRIPFLFISLSSLLLSLFDYFLYINAISSGRIGDGIWN
jgi:hypothetical protein